MSIRRDLLLPSLAISLLLLATISTAYVAINQPSDVPSNTIIIAGSEYGFSDLYDAVEKGTAIVAEEEYAGMMLDELIQYIGIEEPEIHTYRFIASDGFSQTVEWEHLHNGILTEDQRSVFSDLPKAFSVRNVIEIEVK